MTTTTLDKTNFSSTTPSFLPTVPIIPCDWFDSIGKEPDVIDDAITDAIADEIEDRIKDIIPEPIVTDADIKPTQAQVNYSRVMFFLGVVITIMFGVSIFQPATQKDSALQPQAKTEVVTGEIVTTAQATVAEDPPASQQEPIAERDPSLQTRNVLLAETYNQASQLQQQLAEARARYLFSKWQQLAERNPQSYKQYLLSQLKRVNAVMAATDKDLIGNAQQSQSAASVVVDAQAISLELIRANVAEGKMESPDNLRDRQDISVIAPSISLSQLAKSIYNVTYYEDMLQGADREAERQKEIALRKQRTKAESKDKPVTGLLKKNP